MFGNSPLGPQIAEARRQDDFARAAAYRTRAHLQPDNASSLDTVPVAAVKSIRYRIGTAVISLGQRVSGVELRPRTMDESTRLANPGVR